MTDAIFYPPTEITDYWGYVKSIDFYDPWLICLIFGHITLCATAVLTRNHNTFQIILFFFLLIVVYFSEYINELAAKNWQKFSRQQYFDSNGLFISTFFSIPVLLICMLMIGNWLYSSTQIMAKVKTAQLKQRLKEQKQQSVESESQPNARLKAE
ncbi:hypothetical protein HA402_000830 [Bradysia odoriphaga]|nr:hypothetical protein HA402_000830 [Bradysia odoriphaga]